MTMMMMLITMMIMIMMIMLLMTMMTIIGTLGSFSIDDGNGSENVSFKMNSRFLNLCRVYSNLLKMASVGKCPWS